MRHLQSVWTQLIDAFPSVRRAPKFFAALGRGADAVALFAWERQVQALAQHEYRRALREPSSDRAHRTLDDDVRSVDRGIEDVLGPRESEPWSPSTARPSPSTATLSASPLSSSVLACGALGVVVWEPRSWAALEGPDVERDGDDDEDHSRNPMATSSPTVIMTTTMTRTADESTAGRERRRRSGLRGARPRTVVPWPMPAGSSSFRARVVVHPYSQRVVTELRAVEDLLDGEGQRRITSLRRRRRVGETAALAASLRAREAKNEVLRWVQGWSHIVSASPLGAESNAGWSAVLRHLNRFDRSARVELEDRR